MTLLLVYPPLDSYTNYWHPHLGFGYINEILLNNGYKTKIVDSVVKNWSYRDFEKYYVKTKKPEAVLITATTSEIYSAHKIASIVKKHNKDILTIVGGSHTTALPKLTLEQFKDFDIVVSGEGEYTILEIMDKISKRKRLNNVKGIGFRDKNNKIIITKKREPNINLDKLAYPRWKGFPIKKYKSYLGTKTVVEMPIITGRGCPNRCVFCQRALGNKVRIRPIEDVIDEVENTIKLGAESIYFCDETFTLFKERTKKLMNEFIKRDIGKRIFWHCETRVDSVDEETLRLMKKAGCKLIHFGVESGSDYILEKAKKGINTKQIKKAFKLAKKVGLKTYMFLIFGLPYETKKTINETIRLMMKVNPDYVTIGILVPFPKTEVVNMAKQGIGGLKLMSTDWRDYTKQSGNSISLTNLKEKELNIKKFQIKAYIKFYLRPSRIKNLLELISIKGILYIFFKQIIGKLQNDKN